MKLIKTLNKKINMKKMKFIACTVMMTMPLVFGACGKKDPDASNGKDGSVSNEVSITPSVTPQSIGFTETKPLTEPVLICIDPGHGFSDPGCTSPNLDGDEAEITFKVATLLKQKLERAGADVVLTHDSKTYPSAQEVKAYANEKNIKYAASEIKNNDIFSAYERAVYCQALGVDMNIDLFVSLHINSFDDDPDVSRYDAYYSTDNPYAADLGKFCSALKDKMDNRLLIHATPKKDAMLVTKYAKFPAVLLEMGFATNPSDAAKLNSEEWRNNYCTILTEEIINFVLEN